MNKQTFGHYTTQSGLLGIIGLETFWATNIKFLNDEYEFQHALDLIKNIISVSNITEIHAGYDVYVNYIEELTQQLEGLNSFKAESVFTLSFSEKTDLLSQWRGYCPDNNGFCLIFDINKLLKEIESKYENVYFVKCVYDEDDKESQIRKLLNEYWIEYSKKTTKEDRKNIVDRLTKEIMLFASYFKHPSFSEEEEHRIVIILNYAPDNDLKFREGSISIIPYIELPAPKEYIDKICIGPTSNKALSKRALFAFLDNAFELPMFLSHLKVMHSKTPYRTW